MSSSDLDASSSELEPPVFVRTAKSAAVDLAEVAQSRALRVVKTEAAVLAYMEVDDTDNVDPEGEYEAWVARERARWARDSERLRAKEEQEEEKVRQEGSG